MTNTFEGFAHPITEQKKVDLGSYAFKAMLANEQLANMTVPGLEIEVADHHDPFSFDVQEDQERNYTFDA